jgi:hypothetical protein
MSDDIERERAAPHVSQISKDLDAMITKVRAMARHVELEMEMIKRRQAYVRPERTETRRAIAALKEALHAVNQTLDEFNAKVLRARPRRPRNDRVLTSIQPSVER